MARLLRIILPENQSADAIVSELAGRGFLVDFIGDRKAHEAGIPLSTEPESFRDGHLSSLLGDIESPLTSLLLFCHLKRRLLEKDPGPPSHPIRRKLMEVIRAEEQKIRNVIRLVAELVSLVWPGPTPSGGGAGTANLESLDLRFAIQQAVDLAYPRAEALGCHITTCLDHAILGCWDRSRIQHTCFGLLVCLAREFSGRMIKVSSRLDGGWARVVFAVEGRRSSPDEVMAKDITAKDVATRGVAAHGAAQDREEGVPSSGDLDMNIAETCGLHALTGAIQLQGGTLSIEGSSEGGTIVTILLPVRRDPGMPL